MSADLRSARGAAVFTHADPVRYSSSSGSTSFWATSADDPRQAWNQLIDELLRLRLLQDDWDGAGALAPHPSVVDWAITLAQSFQDGGIPPADRVLASTNGTIYFEWYTPLGYQEIEVISPREAECRWVAKRTDV